MVTQACNSQNWEERQNGEFRASLSYKDPDTKKKTFSEYSGKESGKEIVFCRGKQGRGLFSLPQWVN